MIAAQECVLEMLQLTGNKLREYLPTDEEQNKYETIFGEYEPKAEKTEREYQRYLSSK